MKRLILLTTTIFLTFYVTAQIVNVPDANFKAILLADTLINTNQDGEIQVSEANLYNGSLWIINQNINDLTGIEAFTSLMSLNCSSNPIYNLNVSNNINLTFLGCANNHLSLLNISNNILLSELFCSFNLISSIDISNNTNLNILFCDSNMLTNLDVSNNHFLNELRCNNNQLVSLNLKNDNNLNFTTFYAEDNPNLYCMEVDDSTWSANNWINIDTQSYFSNDCTTGKPEELQTPHIFIYPNPTTSKITIKAEGEENIEVMNLQGKEIYNGKETEINLSEQPKGIYIIKVQTSKGVAVEKVILE